MVQKLLAATAWVSIAVLAYATLTHVEFAYSTYYRLSPFLMRPDMRGYAHFEHVVAFAVFGAIFASAYRRFSETPCGEHELVQSGHYHQSERSPPSRTELGQQFLSDDLS